jgi:hypothetical protein
MIDLKGNNTILRNEDMEEACEPRYRMSFHAQTPTRVIIYGSMVGLSSASSLQDDVYRAGVAIWTTASGMLQAVISLYGFVKLAGVNVIETGSFKRDLWFKIRMYMPACIYWRQVSIGWYRMVSNAPQDLKACTVSCVIAENESQLSGYLDKELVQNGRIAVCQGVGVTSLDSFNQIMTWGIQVFLSVIHWLQLNNLLSGEINQLATFSTLAFPAVYGIGLKVQDAWFIGKYNVYKNAVTPDFLEPTQLRKYLVTLLMAVITVLHFTTMALGILHGFQDEPLHRGEYVEGLMICDRKHIKTAFMAAFIVTATGIIGALVAGIIASRHAARAGTLNVGFSSYVYAAYCVLQLVTFSIVVLVVSSSLAAVKICPSYVEKGHGSGILGLAQHSS